MHADLTKVRQVLFNLLSNACKFTERGTVSLAVQREESDDDAWLSFSVSDTGIGLSAEQLGRLFQEFSQADADTTRKYGGTGLGLALSRRLCRLMGGEITVTSEPGQGSTFTVRLPVDVGADPRDAGRRRQASAGTVLVIDDEAVVRELMQRFLSKEGFRVLTAANGEDGLRLAREQRPDAITLDVMMPGMDGWTVLSALKADPAARRHSGDHADDRRRQEDRLCAGRVGVPHQADRPRAAGRGADASIGAICRCWWWTTMRAPASCCGESSRRKGTRWSRRRTGGPRSSGWASAYRARSCWTS